MLAHIKNAFGYSLAGLSAVIKDEIAFRILLLQTSAILILLVFLPISYNQRAFLVLSAAICLIVELLNSAIENVVDLVTHDWHILAKKAKDMGSAAQFIASASLYFQVMLIVVELFD